MALRNNFGYPLGNPRHESDVPLGDALMFKSFLQFSLGVKLDGVSSVCGFTIDSPSHWLNLKQGRNTIASPMDKGGELEYPEKPGFNSWEGLPEEDIPQKGGYDPESENK